MLTTLKQKYQNFKTHIQQEWQGFKQYPKTYATAALALLLVGLAVVWVASLLLPMLLGLLHKGTTL